MSHESPYHRPECVDHEPESDDSTDRFDASTFDIDGEIPDAGSGGLDGDRERVDQLADCYADKVARQWGTPEGEWWP